MNGDLKDLSPDDSHADGADRSSLDKLTQTLEITADYGVGSSGGPVLDLSGNVVGMVSNTLAVYADSKDKRSLQMNFHHCVPAESILTLVGGEVRVFLMRSRRAGEQGRRRAGEEGRAATHTYITSWGRRPGVPPAVYPISTGARRH